MDHCRHEARNKQPTFRFDLDALRKHRREEAGQLRQRKRDAVVNVHREILKDPGSEKVDSLTDMLMEVDVYNNGDPDVSDEWFSLIYSNDLYEQMRGSMKLRDFINKDRLQSSQIILNLTHLERIFELLGTPNINLMTVFNLVHVVAAATFQADPCQLQGILSMRINAVLILIRLLEMKTCDVTKSNVMLVLGNIAGDSVEVRDWMLTTNVLSAIVKTLEPATYLKLLRDGSWALTNFCEDVERKEALEVLPIIKKLIHHEDHEVLEHSCIVLCELGKAHSQDIWDMGFCYRLVNLLGTSKDDAVIKYALKTIKNFSQEDHCQSLIDHQILPALRRLLSTSQSKCILCLSCEIVASIVYGCTSRMQQVIAADIYPCILPHLRSSDEAVRLEAVCAVRKAISVYRTSADQIEYFVSIGCIESLIEMLPLTINVNTIKFALKALRNSIKSSYDDVSKAFVKCNGENY